LFEVKVPIILLGTAGFSPPREGRYKAHDRWHQDSLQNIELARTWGLSVRTCTPCLSGSD